MQWLLVLQHVIKMNVLFVTNANVYVLPIALSVNLMNVFADNVEFFRNIFHFKVGDSYSGFLLLNSVHENLIEIVLTRLRKALL